MRVCMISRTYPRDVNPGSGSVAYNLAKRLPGEVLYITKRLPGVYAEVPPNVRLVVIPYWEPPVPERPGRLQALWLAAGKALGSTWFLMRAIPEMIRFRPDIVHVHTVLPVLLGAFARIALRRPVAMTFHGTDFVWFRKSRPLQWLVDRTVDVVFCVSQPMSSEMRSLLGRARIVTIPNGVDLEFFQSTGAPRARRIAAVGSLKWQKGYEYLLRAMRLLVDRDPAIELAIAGGGPLEAELRRTAEELGIAANVRFLGVLSHPEVLKLLDGSLVFAMSSVSEGFPRALLEAMACGTPVVVTDVGECAAVAGGAGFVVPPRAPEALAQAIARLVADEAGWRRCSRQALERAQQFTWDEVARRTLAVYEELAAGRRAVFPAGSASGALRGDEQP